MKAAGQPPPDIFELDPRRVLEEESRLSPIWERMALRLERGFLQLEAARFELNRRGAAPELDPADPVSEGLSMLAQRFSREGQRLPPPGPVPEKLRMMPTDRLRWFYDRQAVACRLTWDWSSVVACRLAPVRRLARLARGEAEHGEERGVSPYSVLTRARPAWDLPDTNAPN